MRNLVALLFITVMGSVFCSNTLAADRQAVLRAQDLQTAPLNIQVISEKESDGVQTTELYFNGGQFNGKPSRIYGFYSRPKANGKCPGVLQLHGAGLVVLTPDASIFYAKNGFACLSIDWWGPRSNRKPPYSEFNSGGNMAHNIGGNEPPYHFKSNGPEVDGITNGVHFVQRSFMFLRKRPEVDKNKLFLSGMSAGAHLSLIALSIEPDIKGAAVKYGCGFIRDLPGYFGGYFGPLTFCPQNEQDAWLNVLDPKDGLKDYHASVLLLSGTDDVHFWMPLVLKTYREIPTDKRLLMLPNDNHTQVANEVIPLRYFNSLLKTASPYPDAQQPQAQLKDGMLRLSCQVTTPSKVTTCQFIVKRMPLKTFNFQQTKDAQWEAVTAQLHDGVCTASIPAAAEGEQIIAYLLLEDQTGAKISSDTVEIPEYPQWRGLQK